MKVTDSEAPGGITALLKNVVTSETQPMICETIDQQQSQITKQLWQGNAVSVRKQYHKENP